MEFSIDHLGIAVKSLTAAKSIYEKLGLSVSPEETVEQEKVRLVMVPVGESRLELLEATSDDSAIARFIAKRGEGLHHICMRVPDLAAAVANYRATACGWCRMRSRLALAGIATYSCIRRARPACCSNWWRAGTEFLICNL
jgi:methylmalonyl-CoA epimerase